MFAYSWTSDDGPLDEDVGREVAACASSGSLTEVFFSDEAGDIELAKSICASCTLVQPCLEGALARREPAGVWGGQLFVDGAVVALKRKRGRPPKSVLAGSASQAGTVALASPAPNPSAFASPAPSPSAFAFPGPTSPAPSPPSAPVDERKSA